MAHEESSVGLLHMAQFISRYLFSQQALHKPIFAFILSFSGAWDGAQSLAHARRVLWATSLSPFFFFDV